METKILSKMYLVCNKWTSRNAFTILRQLRIVFWCLWWCTRHCLGAQNSKHFMTILGTLECKTNRVKSCISVCIYITLAVWNFEIRVVASNSVSTFHKKKDLKGFEQIVSLYLLKLDANHTPKMSESIGTNQSHSKVLTKTSKYLHT